MAYEPIFDIAGNVLGDPELRFTPNGVAVCNFRVGINDARADQNNGKQNVHPLVAEVAVWREMAENVAETLTAKMRITAKVRMVELGAYIAKKDDQNGLYKAGDPVGTLKVEALEVGPSLRWQKADVTKVAGNQQGQKQGGGNNQQAQQGGWGNNGQAQQGQGGGWGQNPNGGNQQGGGDPWADGQHPGQNGGSQQTQQGQGGGWGSNQGWGNGGGAQGGSPWGN